MSFCFHFRFCFFCSYSPHIDLLFQPIYNKVEDETKASNLLAGPPKVATAHSGTPAVTFCLDEAWSMEKGCGSIIGLGVVARPALGECNFFKLYTANVTNFLIYISFISYIRVYVRVLHK